MRRVSTLAKEEIATNKAVQIRALCQLDSCQQRQNRKNTIDSPSISLTVSEINKKSLVPTVMVKSIHQAFGGHFPHDVGAPAERNHIQRTLATSAEATALAGTLS